MTERFNSYSEFWPFYLAEHGRPQTRALHFAGTGAGVLCAAFALAAGRPGLLIGALAVAYGAAWAGHLGFEKNRPATFRHPLWSLISDFRMAALWCAGRLEAEYQKCGVPYRPPSRN